MFGVECVFVFFVCGFGVGLEFGVMEVYVFVRVCE